MIYIGCDFSINKPAVCLQYENSYEFIAWPFSIKDTLRSNFRNSGVFLIDRDDIKCQNIDLSVKLRHEIQNASYLSNLIITTLKKYLTPDTLLAFEGLSYASSGDVALQLGGYKYVLMDKLSEFMNIDNIYTYSPISIKSVAGCAKRGMGKIDMIDKFILDGPECTFRNSLINNPEMFQTPKSKKWEVLVDDLVDAYWTLETLKLKESLI